MRSEKEILKQIKRVRAAVNSWWPEAKTIAFVLFPPRKPKKSRKGGRR